MSRDKPCVRCGRPEDEHPCPPECLHYVEPAPRWLKRVTGNHKREGDS